MQRRATHCTGTIGCTAARRVGKGEDGGKIILRDRYLEPAPRSDGRVSNEFKFLLADTDINSKLLLPALVGAAIRLLDVTTASITPDFAAVFSRLPLGDLSGSCWLINESVFAFIVEDVIS